MTQSQYDGLIPLSDIQERPINWLFPHFIARRKINILEGEPGKGKSTFTIDVAARVTTGTPMPDGTTVEPGNVIVLTAEDSAADTVVPRLRAAGGDPSRVFTLKEHSQHLYLPEDMVRFAQFVRDYEAKLVVFDPFSAYVSSKFSTLKEQDMRHIMHPLSLIAESSGAAILLIRHFTKNPNQPPILRGAGSMGIGAAARSVFSVIDHPDHNDRRLLAPVKLNVGARPLPWEFTLETVGEYSRIAWLGQTDIDVETLLNEPLDERRATKDVKHVLLEILASGPQRPIVVYGLLREAGVFVSDRTVRRVSEGLVRRAHLGFGASSIYLWYLPEHESQIGYIKQLAKNEGLKTATIALLNAESL